MVHAEIATIPRAARNDERWTTAVLQQDTKQLHCQVFQFPGVFGLVELVGCVKGRMKAELHGQPLG